METSLADSLEQIVAYAIIGGVIGGGILLWSKKRDKFWKLKPWIRLSIVVAIVAAVFGFALFA